jgi:hypothetical protein
MVWNYRVIEHEGIFYIHEVYYNDNGDITAISEDPMHPHGETIDELERDMEHFQQALGGPVLKKEKIKFAEIDGIDSRPVRRKGRKRYEI